MTGAFGFPWYSLPPRAIGRFRCALALSVAFHLLLGAALRPESSGGRAPSAAISVMTVRLEAQPAMRMAGVIHPEPEIPAAAPPTRRPVPAADRKRRAATAALEGRPAREARPLSPPPVADPTYYAARDLDVYPRPVAPLALDRIAAGNTVPMRVAVALRIDEQGAVNDVAFPEPAAPNRLREELRAALSATRFLPARKDGRAVRSLVILSVDFAQIKREP